MENLSGSQRTNDMNGRNVIRISGLYERLVSVCNHQCMTNPLLLWGPVNNILILSKGPNNDPRHGAESPARWLENDS